MPIRATHMRRIILVFLATLFFILAKPRTPIGAQTKPGGAPPPLTPAQQAELQQKMNEVKNTLPSMQAAALARFQAFKVQQQSAHVAQQLQVAERLRSQTSSAPVRQALEERISALNGLRTSLGSPQSTYTGLVAGLTSQNLRRYAAGSGVDGSNGGLGSGSNSNSNSSTSSGTCASSPSPVITSLSVSQGQPGDLVIVNGNGFGGSPGEVKFVLNPGMTYPATLYTWTSTQITAQVPDASGILGYNGAVFVSTCAPSNSVPFQFVPESETKTMAIPFSSMTSDYGACPSYSGGHQCGQNSDGSVWERLQASFLIGIKGDTLFFQGFQLRNGWVVASGSPDFAVSPAPDSHMGARIASSSPGTSSPYVDVHWWDDPPGRTIQYTLAIWITGPKGTVYQ
jgi:hypothetical protein